MSKQNNIWATSTKDDFFSEKQISEFDKLIHQSPENIRSNPKEVLITKEQYDRNQSLKVKARLLRRSMGEDVWSQQIKLSDSEASKLIRSIKGY